VVTRDVAAHSFVAGNPMRVIREGKDGRDEDAGAASTGGSDDATVLLSHPEL
jgi:serine acetyltransferase